MCEKCVEIDQKIRRYRRIVTASVSDPLTIKRTDDLIANLEAQKTALHPESETEA
jgi:hypothetical protein